jgi:anti-repressor protein
MNELIRITEVEGKKSVSAREIYSFLELSPLQFVRWSKKNITENEFAEKGQDYQGYNFMLEGNEMVDYALSIDFAKKLCMLARTEKGEEARRYFIECEKQIKAVFQVPQTFSQALFLAGKLAEENEKQAKYIEENRPKIEFFEAVAQSKTAIDMRKASAVLDIRGFGRNNLLEFLRQKGILDGGNIPYRKYQDQGYFRVIETKWTDKYGETKISFKTVVYQKGLDFIRRKIEEA